MSFQGNVHEIHAMHIIILAVLLLVTTFEEIIISIFRKQNDRIDILSFLVGSPVFEIGLNVV